MDSESAAKLAGAESQRQLEEDRRKLQEQLAALQVRWGWEQKEKGENGV